MANTKITTNVIADDAITTAKIADDAVGNDQLASGLTLGGNTAATLSTAAQPNITSLGTLTALTVDDITIDGSTISDGGNLTLDAAGDIHLDADSEVIRIRHDGGDIGMLQMTSNDLILRSMVGDKDLIFKGNDSDGGGVITALTLDMSEAGKATFNNVITATGATFTNSSSGATATGNTVLTVEGNDNTELSILGGSSSVLALNFGHSGDNNEGLIYFNTTSGSENMQLESSKHITFRAGAANVANNVYFKSYNTDIMTIDGSNNRVGIGTTAPGSLLELRKTTAGNITGGTSNQGAVLTLHHEAQWENGYTGGDFLGAINFSSGDASTGEGVRGAIKVSVDTYYNTNKMHFYVAQSNATTLVERMELDDELTFKGRTGTSPAVEMVNMDSEDGDTGRETTLRFKGHRSGGEMVTNAQISGHHFGNADDDKGGIIFWANEGSAGLAQKMRITDQYIGIGPGGGGATSPSALLGVVGSNSNTAADAAMYVASGGSSDWSQIIYEPSEYALNIRSGSSMSYAFYISDASNNTQRFRINGVGSVWRDGSTQITSDERKKKNIVDMPSQWDEFKQIRWRNFEWKDEVIKGTQFGVIAQEVQAINSDLVSVDPLTKEEIEEGIEDPKMLSVMVDMLQAKSMKALQEAMERIEALEAEVKALKGE